jgi:hypothetical protein
LGFRSSGASCNHAATRKISRQLRSQHRDLSRNRDALYAIPDTQVPGTTKPFWNNIWFSCLDAAIASTPRISCSLTARTAFSQTPIRRHFFLMSSRGGAPFKVVLPNFFACKDEQLAPKIKAIFDAKPDGKIPFTYNNEGRTPPVSFWIETV